jgi:hypothetical protein
MGFLAEVGEPVTCLVTAVNCDRAILFRISLGEHYPESILLYKSFHLNNEEVDPLFLPDLCSLPDIQLLGRTEKKIQNILIILQD